MRIQGESCRKFSIVAQFVSPFKTLLMFCRAVEPMSTRWQTGLALVLFTALFGLIAPLPLIDFIPAHGGAIRDNGSVYESTQPWWIGLPTALAWISTVVWLLLEFPARQVHSRVGGVDECP